MARSQIRAIFLDAGGTLFTERRPRAATYAIVARAHGAKLDDAAMADVLAATHAELPSSLEGCYRYSLEWFRTFNARALVAAGVSARRTAKAHEDLVRRFQDPRSYRVYPEVIETLAALNARGVLLGVVSNWTEHLPELCRALGLAEHVRFVLASAELRAQKPERAIFERALFRAGVPAEETLHVGDRPELDVCGALDAGLRAAWLDRAASGQPPPREGVPVLRDLGGLLALHESAACADAVAAAR
jgi:putative hydrolase of the HAD superfamily